jgi:arylsulfatase A-like enzyme
MLLLILLLNQPAGAGGAAGAAKKRRRHNIILFLVDDMGWQETSLPFHTTRTALNRRYQTPAMERLAQEGMKFTRAYASAVCSPTRISILSGMNAARHRVTNWTLRQGASPDDENRLVTPPAWNLNGATTSPGIPGTVRITPLPELLRQAGYRTIHVGKAHFGATGTPGADPRHFGFEINIGGHAAGAPGSYWGERNFSSAWRSNRPASANSDQSDRIWDVPGLDAWHGKPVNLTEVLTIEAINQVEKAVQEDQPFYLYLSHYAIHAPWEEDKRYYQKYLDLGLKPFEALRASMIESMDSSLGSLMNAIARLGVADETLVIFASDNGAPHAVPGNLPLRGQKLAPYEGGIRVPMIVRWPGLTQPATTSNTPVIIEDLFPTILDAAGIGWQNRTIQTIDGRSLRPHLRGLPEEPDRPLLFHFPHQYYGQSPFSALITGEWKLIYHHASQQLELFNLRRDIGEEHDLAPVEANRVRRLASLLTSQLQLKQAQLPGQRGTGAPVPLPALSLRKARPGSKPSR